MKICDPCESLLRLCGFVGFDTGKKCRARGPLQIGSQLFYRKPMALYVVVKFDDGIF